MDLEEETKRMTRRVKKIQISDNDTEEVGAINGAFFEHFTSTSSNYFQISPEKKKSNRRQVVIHSDIFTNRSSILCGLDNSHLTVLDISQDLSSEVIGLPQQSSARRHHGLSCARCSKVSPAVFYSSSSEDGRINVWDGRVNSVKPVQFFSGSGDQIVTIENKKPILNFDVSPGDQFLCAGTELMDEDCYLFFWDLRSSKLLGAYWESHSDDITAVKFHPSKPNSLISGGTDGILNLYNLLEPTEDDALLFSFNSESSVEKISWNSGASSDQVACITHTNDMKVWDVTSGDAVVHFSRTAVAGAMMRSNPDAVHLNECYETPKGNGKFGLLACSLSGECARFLQVTDKNELKPRAIFLNDSPPSVIQTAEYMSNENRWITFDETGLIRIWSLDSSSKPIVQNSDARQLSKITEKRSTRFKPYSTEKPN